MGGHWISPRPFCPDLSVAPVPGSRGGLGVAGLKKSEEVMEILEAFDLTGSLRGAAALVVITRRSLTGLLRGTLRAAVCRSLVGVGRWSTGSARRSTSWWIGRAGGSERTGRMRSSSGWGTWVLSARRGGRSRRRSGAGVSSTAGGPGRGWRSPGTTARTDCAGLLVDPHWAPPTPNSPRTRLMRNKASPKTRATRWATGRDSPARPVLRSPRRSSLPPLGQVGCGSPFGGLGSRQ